MADTVTSQIVQNGPQNIIARFTNVSDGTGETGVVKIDATSTGAYGVLFKGITYYPGTHLVVRAIDYDVKAMGVQLQWVATANVDMLPLGGFGRMFFKDFGGLTVPTGVAGITGSIAFTTTGQMPNSSYSIVLHLKKYCAFD